MRIRKGLRIRKGTCLNRYVPRSHWKKITSRTRGDNSAEGCLRQDKLKWGGPGMG